MFRQQGHLYVQQLTLARQVIVAMHQAKVVGIDPATANRLFLESGNPSSVYKHNPKCVASVVLMWVGWAATVAR